jgi:sirohydrochlorin cobaltochelatase
MVRVMETYRASFRELHIATPVLNKEEDCKRLVPVLCEMLAIQTDREYILMGHGTEDAANIRYEQMNQAIAEAGYDNVRIASVEAKPDLENAIAQIQKRRKAGMVVLHPFMVVAGDHANNDMAGCEDSYVTRLQALGYQTKAVIKGLGEYPQFRRIYVEKLRQILSEKR